MKTEYSTIYRKGFAIKISRTKKECIVYIEDIEDCEVKSLNIDKDATDEQIILKFDEWYTEYYKEYL